MKAVAANLAMMVFGLLVGLLVLEGAVRLMGYLPPSVRPDPLLGYAHVPNARYHHVGEEGSSNGQYNADGWRDAPHAPSAAPGTTRILILGDSFVSAYQVPLDSTFHRRLERALNARALPGHRFEVIALGQDGNGTTSELLTYEHKGRRYAPDVVAPLFIQNDIADNLKGVALDPSRPFFVEEGDSLRLDLSFNQSPAFRKWSRPNWAGENSALWSAVRTAMFRLRTKQVPPRMAGGEVQDGYYRTWNFDARVPPESLAAFRITEKVYARFARTVAGDGRRFIVFHSGFPQQEDARLLATYRERATFDANKAARWLMAVGAREGFPVVPLGPAFRAASQRLGQPLWFGRDSTFGHWNAAGHAVAADAMARYFARTLAGLDTTGTTSADVPGVAELERY